MVAFLRIAETSHISRIKVLSPVVKQNIVSLFIQQDIA